VRPPQRWYTSTREQQSSILTTNTYVTVENAWRGLHHSTDRQKKKSPICVSWIQVNRPPVSLSWAVLVTRGADTVANSDKLWPCCCTFHAVIHVSTSLPWCRQNVPIHVSTSLPWCWQNVPRPIAIAVQSHWFSGHLWPLGLSGGLKHDQKAEYSYTPGRDKVVHSW